MSPIGLSTVGTTISDLGGKGATLTGGISYATGTGTNNIKFRLTGTNRIVSTWSFVNYTFIIIGSKDTGSVGKLFSATTGNRFLGWGLLQKKLCYVEYDVYGYGSNQTTNNGQEVMYMLTNNSFGEKKFYENSVRLNTTSSGSSDWGTVSVGVDGVFSSSAAGWVYEVICFPYSLSDTEAYVITELLKRYFTFIT